MFVLMVAELLPILSDTASGLSRRAELGDRFRFWRGGSGARYLFSAVPFEALTDFRQVAVIVAEPTADGAFLAWSAASIDSGGNLYPLDAAWPSCAPTGSFVFVHFLAENEAGVDALLGDLFPYRPNEEFKLAA